MTELEYWKRRCLLAEQVIAESPCDDGISASCLSSKSEAIPQLSDPRWTKATDELVGHTCYGMDFIDGIGKGALNRSPVGYFYIHQNGGFEFAVSKVIKIEE